MWKVAVTEHERGWGSRIDSIKEFETYEEAVEFQKKFNSRNTESVVPDWYMVAHEPYEV